MTGGAAHNPLQAYREQQVLDEDPMRLLFMVYDVARRACREKNRRLALRALEEMIGALNLEQGEIARGMLSLYDYLMRRVREGEWDEVTQILNTLRSAWVSAQAQQKRGDGKAARSLMETGRAGGVGGAECLM
ncbi:MAG: flagellar protein FliS [Candidatus Eisenbacteria bacterium]|uniref:Flagellar protein FliS n=1 Tax=Eiseniibacteriota bacterium TaxID=2212470 RepID=A0A948W743_UNCEI|nr:flagellar protein FliS [Candidatus Eisenbacteria bacterium]MBU1950928.1 flagellar protein FliS [Candidatus Eisenbacteria bacterium]MBU2692199.1 flagellar protein FliS [Candidatus Eisenbacteria bacterium]